jgi:uncharacterized protein with HEPN domain
MRDDREHILDMLEAVDRIGRHAEKGREAFEKDELIQTWVVHHLEIIGEAASKLSKEFRDTYREVPWPQIVAMRNVMAQQESNDGKTRLGDKCMTRRSGRKDNGKDMAA